MEEPSLTLSCRERAVPDKLDGTVNETYFAGLEDVSGAAHSLVSRRIFLTSNTTMA